MIKWNNIDFDFDNERQIVTLTFDKEKRFLNREVFGRILEKLYEDKIKEYNIRMDNLPYGDPEAAHSKADDIILDILTDFGLHDIVEKFVKIEKWYA